MNKHEKFLNFNGTNIVFINIDGTYHVALRPICEALNVDVRRSRDLAKKDPIFGSEVSEQALQVEKNGKKQLRYLTCVPEKYIYAWIFSLKSDSKELNEYKKTCYDLLYNHFHGVIGRRKELLLGQAEVTVKIDELKTKLFQMAEYKELIQLEEKKKIYSKQMIAVDKQVLNQSEIKFE